MDGLTVQTKHGCLASRAYVRVLLSLQSGFCVTKVRAPDLKELDSSEALKCQQISCTAFGQDLDVDV